MNKDDNKKDINIQNKEGKSWEQEFVEQCKSCTDEDDFNNLTIKFHDKLYKKVDNGTSLVERNPDLVTAYNNATIRSLRSFNLTVIIIVLVVVLAFALFNIFFHKDRVFESDGVIYEKNSDCYIVKGFNKDKINNEITIHSNIDDIAVTKINSKAFYRCKKIISVIIPDTITEIGLQAFAECENLEYIEIGESVTTISGEAFYKCNSLMLVVLPNSVKTIGQKAFYYCSSLADITIGKSVNEIEYEAFSGCDDVEEIRYNAVSCKDSYAKDIFFGLGRKTKGTTVIIGKSVKMIPEFMFGSFEENANNIVNVDFEENSGCKTIAKWAFYNCSKLKNVILPESITKIGEEAFYNCNSLTQIDFNSVSCSDFTEDGGFLRYKDRTLANNLKVVIGKAVKKIPQYLFYNVNNLIDIDFKNAQNLESIGSYAFCGTNIKTLDIPNSVQELGSGAFAGTEITKLEIPTKVEKIGDHAFSGTAIAELKIPNNIGMIGNYAFSMCDKLASVIFLANEAIDDNIQNLIIGTYAFSNCNKLNSVVIPDRVSRINECAFTECENLQSVSLPSNIYVGYGAFENCINLVDLATREGNANNPITTIGDYAFSGCIGLKFLTIPGWVEKIGKASFSNCTGLKSLTIEDGVKIIGESAFSGCEELRLVSVSKTVSVVGESAFSNTLWYNNQSDGAIYIGSVLYKYKGNTRENFVLTIVDGTTTISNRVFYNCRHLIQIVIPSSVKMVGNSAFYCSGLIIAYYGGTKEDFLDLEIEDGNAFLIENLYFYSATQPNEADKYWHYVNGEIKIWT